MSLTATPTYVPDQPPYNIGNVSSTFTPNMAKGRYQKATLTGDGSVGLPTNGAEGSMLRLWVTASGADRALDFSVSIKIPTDSGIVLPKTLTQNKLYVILLQRNATSWMLVSLVGGF